MGMLAELGDFRKDGFLEHDETFQNNPFEHTLANAHGSAPSSGE